MSNTDKYQRVGQEETELIQTSASRAGSQVGKSASQVGKSRSLVGEPEKEEKIPEKVVNFQKLLNEYKERAETKLAYTIQQTDDVVFIDNKHVVALEYIFYQAKGGNYHRLIKQRIKEGEKRPNTLGLENYITKDDDGLSAFTDEPRVYHVLKSNYLNEHSQTGFVQRGETGLVDSTLLQEKLDIEIGKEIHDAAAAHDKEITDLHPRDVHEGRFNFMPTEDGQAYAEAIVSLWKISKSGQLYQLKVQNFQYHGNYSQSKDQQSRLQLSTDKKWVSLTLHNDTVVKDETTKDKKVISMRTEGIQFHAWNTADLEPICDTIAAGGDMDDLERILKNIEEPFDGKLTMSKIVGRSKYVIRESIRFVNLHNKKDYQKQYILWQLFDIMTGEKVYEIDNLYESEESKQSKNNQLMEDMNIDAGGDNQRQKKLNADADVGFDIRLIGILPKERKWTKKGGEDDAADDYGNELENLKWDPMKDSASEATDDEEVQSEYGSEEESGEEKADNALQESKYEYVKEDEEYEGGSGDDKAKDEDSFKNLDIIFFFARDQKGKIDDELEKSKPKEDKTNEKKDKKKRKQEKLDKKKKQTQDWIWTKVKVNLKKIIETQEEDTAEGRKKYVNELGLKKFEDDFMNKEKKDFFEIPCTWFQGAIMNWEHKVQVTANKYNKHFGLKNQSKCLIYDSTSIQSIPKKDEGKNIKIKPFVDYVIPSGQIVTFGRNQLTKRFLQLVTRTGNSCKTTVYYSSNSNGQNTKASIGFQDDHQVAWQDCIDIRIPSLTKRECDNLNQQGELQKVFLLQSVTISGGDQAIWLKTQVKVKKTEDKANFYEDVEKKQIAQYQKGIFPVFVYNIGVKKIIIQNTLQKTIQDSEGNEVKDGGKQWIMELTEHEQFMCFVDFNKDEDLGFFPKGLRIECCSKFAYITQNTSKKDPIFNLNVLLVDPYNDHPQIATFRSTKTVDVGLDQVESGNDIVIKAIIYNNKANKDDKNYDLKIIIQKPNNYETYKLEDNKVEGESNNEDYCSELGSSDFESSDDESDSYKMAQVPFILADNGYIYYIKYNDGYSFIYEINPQNDDEDMLIYSLKSSVCYGFNVAEGSECFYFMDDTKQVITLERIKEQRLLYPLRLSSNIKDKDRSNFKDIATFNDVILSNKYIIQKSMIFYLWDQQPLASGILDMEQLASQQKQGESPRQYSAGPYKYDGSDNFVMVYQSQDPNERFQWYQVIYSLPDCTTVQLMGDPQKKVDMCTFNDQGEIILKIGYRFMIYTTDGIFKDEINFEPREGENEDQILAILKTQQISAKIKENQEKKKEEEAEAAAKAAGDDSYVKPLTKKPERIGLHNRMKLHKSSITFKYYLFEDRIKKILAIYTLEQDENGEYVFFFKYDLDLRQEGTQALFDFLDISIENGMDEFFEELNEGKQMNVQLEDNGDVTFTINKLTADNEGNAFHRAEDIGKEKKKQDKPINVKIYACVFSKRHDGKFKDFSSDCEFKPDATEAVLARYQLQYDNLSYLLKIEKDQQDHLTQAFKNPEKTNKLMTQLEKIDEKRNNLVFSEIYDQNLLVVQCGRYIRYGYFDDIIWDSDDAECQMEFQEANINFDKEILIEKIWGTQKDYNLQIIAIDDVKKILFILTWDFRKEHDKKIKSSMKDKNVESSMLQFAIEPDTQPQNYIVKGMKEKMNYFLNKYQIFDLEHNIPLQTTNFNSLNGEGIKHHTNQRKIFENPSKSLSIDHGHILNFPLSRMDLIFWMNISGLGEDPDQIIQNTTLQTFNVIYDGNSLIHHFAGNQKVIEAIHAKYIEAKQDGSLTKEQKNMPLVLLHPDPQGKTALELALEQLVPRSFECMIDMLEDFPDFCISKMMLKAMPSMIDSGSTIINKFFDSATYKPPLMQYSLNVSWPSTRNEYIFPSPTSLLTEQSLEKLICDDYWMNLQIIQDLSVRALTDQLAVEEDHGKNGDKLRDQQLTVSNKHESKSKRIQVEAIDFDWIFVDDNSKTLMSLLNDQDSELFLSKSIKIFIEFMWEYYFPLIMQKIFIPYIVYLVAFVYLISSIAGDYLKRIKSYELEHPGVAYYEEANVWTCILLSFACFCFLVYFQKVEVKEFAKSPLAYVKSFWNWFDLLQFFFNTAFLICLGTNVSSGFNTVDIHVIRTIGAMAGWVMWIKVFYWMRLFKPTSYFIILIMRTITDSLPFMIMLGIIIFAYANLNYILQLNVNGPKYKDDVYVTEYVEGQGIFNSVMAQYMIALGQFEAGSLGNGPSAPAAWFAFLTASYVLTIVFMNLLIAIMGNTFGEVLEIQDQAALKTFIELMDDYSYMLDTQKVFKNMRYIIRCSPDVKEEDAATDIQSHVENVGIAITGKQEYHAKQMTKKLQTFEKATRNMLKNQQSSIMELKVLFNNLKDQVNVKKTEEE